MEVYTVFKAYENMTGTDEPIYWKRWERNISMRQTIRHSKRLLKAIPKASVIIVTYKLYHPHHYVTANSYGAMVGCIGFVSR